MNSPVSNATLIQNLEEERGKLQNIINNTRNRVKEVDDSIIRTNERIVTRKMSEKTGEILIHRFETERDELETTFLSKMFELKVIEDRIQHLKETKETPLDSASEEFKNVLIHRYVEKVTVEPTTNWGEYELSIIYFDMNMDFATIKSMSKKAYTVIGNEISFEYLERFSRPKSS